MFGVGVIRGVVRSRQTFIGVIGGVSMNRAMSISVIVSRGWGVVGRVIRSGAVKKGVGLGIVGRVNMSRFVNRDVGISRIVSRG